MSRVVEGDAAFDDPVYVYIVDNVLASIKGEVEVLSRLPGVTAFPPYENPERLYYALSELFQNSARENKPVHAVAVIDVNSEEWAEMTRFGITRHHTVNGRISGIAFADRVLRSAEPKYERYSGIPILFMTNWVSDPLVRKEVQALVDRSDAPTRLAAKKENENNENKKGEFEKAITDLVEIARNIDLSSPLSDVTLASQQGAPDAGRMVVQGVRSRPFEPLVDAIVRYWRLPKDMKYTLLGVDPGDGERLSAALSGFKKPLTRDLIDRVECLEDIRLKLSAVFDDQPPGVSKQNVENDWLRSPVADLRHMTPLDLLSSGTMEDLLTVKGIVYRKCKIW